MYVNAIDLEKRNKYDLFNLILKKYVVTLKSSKKTHANSRTKVVELP